MTAPATEVTPSCPLCCSGNGREYSRDDRRRYLHCTSCGLVFVPREQLLSEGDEKKRYDLHRNGPDDDGYRTFLQRLVGVMEPHLAPRSSGLDFGSGPEPLLSRLFEEAGHRMELYDRFYAPHLQAFERQYDFIVASEVVEHLRDPRQELDRVWSCLSPGGLLGIMTRPVVSRDEFPRWYYKNDLTHIRFFSPGTFRWLALRWGASLEFAEEDIALLGKGGHR